MATTLYDQSGKPVQVDDTQVTQALLSGQYGSGAPQVKVRASGKVYDVPTENLAKFSQGMGGQIHVLSDAEVAAHEQEKQQAAQQEKYGGVGGTIAAGAEGVARGLTFGLSDPLAIAVGGDAVRQHLANEKAANPIVSGGGEILGALAPIALSGGAAAPEEAAALGGRGLVEGANVAREASTLSRAADVTKAVGVIPRATAEAGQFLEHTVGSVLGDYSTSLAARTATKAISKGLGAGLEGAIINMGDTVSEDALGDHQLTGQQLLASAGHGFVFGSLLGAGAGAVGELGGDALSAIKRSPKLQELAETQAWRSLNPGKRLTASAERAGGFRAVGRELLDSNLIQAGDTVESIAPRVEAARTAAGERIGGMLNELDQQGAGGVKVATLEKAIKSNLPKAATQLEYTAGTMGRVDALLSDLAKAGGDRGEIKLSDLHSLRSNLDTIINWEKRNPTPALEALRSARSSIEGALVDHADAEAEKLGVSKSFKDDFIAAKKRYQKLAIADDAAQDAVSRMYANQSLSLTDKMFMAHGIEGAVMHHAGRAMAGAAAGAVGGPHEDLGGLARDMALGAMAGVASKTIRERGNATLATFLNRTQDLGAIKALQKGLDGRMQAAASKAVHGPPVTSAPKFGNYDAIVARVRAANDNAAHESAIGGHLGSIAGNAPKVSQAFSDAAKRATSYLAGKIPSERPPTPFATKMPPADPVAQEALLKADRAIENPTVVLKDIRTGMVDSETVNAVKAVYPDVFANMRNKVISEIGSKGDSVPYERKVLLGSVFGFDPDGTLDPGFIAALQAPKAAQQKAGPPKEKPTNLKGFDSGQLASRSPLK